MCMCIYICARCLYCASCRMYTHARAVCFARRVCVYIYYVRVYVYICARCLCCACVVCIIHARCLFRSSCIYFVRVYVYIHMRALFVLRVCRMHNTHAFYLFSSTARRHTTTYTHKPSPTHPHSCLVISSTHTDIQMLPLILVCLGTHPPTHTVYRLASFSCIPTAPGISPIATFGMYCLFAWHELIVLIRIW